MGLGDLDTFIGKMKNSWQKMTSPATLNDYNYVNQNMSISKAEEAAQNLSLGRRLNALGDAFKGGDYYETADKYADNIRDRYAKHRQDVRSNVSDDNTIASQGIQNTAAATNEFVNQSTVPEQIAATRLANQSVGLSNTGQVLDNTLKSNTLPANTQILENQAKSGQLLNDYHSKMYPLQIRGEGLANTSLSLQNQAAGINNQTLGAQNQANLRGTNLANNQLFQQMKHDHAMNPLLQNAQVLSNEAQTSLNAHNKAMYPMLQNQQQKINAAQHWQNQITKANATGNNKAPFMLGGTAENNFKDGQVMRMNPNTGLIEPVQVSPAIKNLYAAEEMKNWNSSAAKSGAVKHPTRGGFITKSEQAADKTFAKQVGEHKPALVQNNQAVMEQVIEELDDEDLTGFSANPLKFFTNISRMVDPDGSLGIAAILDSEGLDAQQRVAGVIQQQLRETLGAQFTQKEGMLLIDRAFNPRLSEEKNKRRLASWLNVMKLGNRYYQNKVNWYNTHGTIAGFDQTGKLLAGVYNAANTAEKIMKSNSDDVEKKELNSSDNTTTSDESLDDIMSNYTTN